MPPEVSPYFLSFYFLGWLHVKECSIVAVFKYSGDSVIKEGSHENGTVVAQDKLEAYDKLRQTGLTNIHLKKVSGLAAFMEQLRASR